MKQESKNKLMVSSLLGLLLVIVLLFLFQGRSEKVDKNIFRIQDLSAIDKIILESSGDPVTLTYNGSRWKVDNDYDADEQLVTVLFATLQQAETKRSVAANLRDSTAKTMRAQGVKVSLFEGESLLKEIYVGGNSMKTEAYFMDEKNGPYVMSIPGYRVYVSGVFEVGQSEWRDKRIFNFNWRNFKKLNSQVYNVPGQSFEIEDQGSGFDLVNSSGTDTTRLNDYLDAVSLLLAKKFISAGYKNQYDSLLKTQPSVRIEILDLGNNVYALDLYKPLRDDPNVLGKLNENEAVIFDRQQIIPLMRTKDYFVEQRP